MRASELPVYLSVYTFCTDHSERTFKGVKDSYDELFRTFKLEKRTSHDTMDKPVVLIRRNP